MGETHQFSVEISPATAKIQEVTWSSDNPTVATIDQNGLMRALLRGSAHIIAISKDGNKKAQCQIMVGEKKTSVKYKIYIDNKKIKKIEVGTEIDYSYYFKLEKQTFKEGGNYSLDDFKSKNNIEDVIWYSSNESVVTVDQNGHIKGVFPGKATINVITAPHGVIGKCEVKVLATHVKKVILDKKKLTLTAGETSQLTATITPDNATIKDVTWTSDNENVARVDANGKVTALSAGLATITVTTVDKGKTATCQVLVKGAGTNQLVAPDDFESGGNPF